MATEDTQDVAGVERELSTLKSAYNQSQAFRRRFDVAPVATPKATDSRGDAFARTSVDFQGGQERDGVEDAAEGGDKENCQRTEGDKIPYIRKDSMHRGESFMNMPTRLSESLMSMNQSFRGLDVSDRLRSFGDSVACLMQGEE